MILHGYWRSSAAYRVRIALNLKGLAYEQRTVDLRRGEQRAESYLGLNPQGLVPALEAEGRLITQSLAIIEWLDERYPEPPLLPAEPKDRAAVRAIALTIGCDIHPLQNLRVLNALRSDFGADKAGVLAWLARWIGDGLAACEAQVARHGGRLAYGDRPSVADCFLVPQLYAAERFGVPLDPFPRVLAAGAAALALDPVAAAHPLRQPDADPD